MLTNRLVDLKNRFPIAVGTLLAIFALVYFANTLIGQIVVVCVAAALAAVGVWEYVQFLKVKEIELPYPIMATGAVVWTAFLSISLVNEKLYFLSGIIFIVYSLVIFFHYFNKIENAIIHLSTSFFGFIYVTIPIGIMLKILYPYTAEDGRLWLVYLVVVTKFSDIGAYLFGKMWGTKKLAPALSPSKTWTGAVAGFCFSIVVSLICFWLTRYIPEGAFSLTWMRAWVLGAVIGIFGQVGDLAESLLKRDVGIKDSNSIPGMGGVLDTLDSLLITAPLLYLLLKVI